MITLTSTLTEEDKVMGVDAVFIVDCTNNAPIESVIEVYAK